MKKVNLRKVQAEERKWQIVDTALAVFASKGFKGTSIKDIAETAGISQGLMYHYFPSKEALLTAIIDRHSFLPGLRTILTDTANQPLERVFKKIANGFLDVLDEKKALVTIMIRDVETNPDVSNAWTSLCREGVSLFQKYLETLVADGKLRAHNTEVAARSLLGTIFMFHFTRNVFLNSPLTRSQFIDEVYNNLITGIGRN
jgi:AcrR family transcriptional regulator